MERRFSLSIIYTPPPEPTLHRPNRLAKRHTVEIFTVGNEYLADRISHFSNDISLVHILNNEETVKIFKRFLEEEHSKENLEFWLGVNRYKRQGFIRRATAKRIHAKFIAYGSKNEINIPHYIRMGIIENLRFHQLNLFDEAQTHVYKLMAMDSFQRFRSTELFLKCQLIHLTTQLKRFSKHFSPC